MFDIEGFIYDISKFTSTTHGETRLPFTKASYEAFLYICSTMESIGLKVYSDRYGTVQGHLDGYTKESIIIGSHYDSVINGGMYDGIVGIAVGIAVADYFISNNLQPKYSIDVLALNDEEGVRFTEGFLSSKAICEELDVSKFKDMQSDKTLVDILNEKKYGKDIISLSTSLSNAIQYIEVHIEQGSILEINNCIIGIVDSIVGIKRVYITIYGDSNHAGTTPMENRKDALVEACRIISKIPKIVSEYQKIVATVGMIDCYPNAVNVIPSKVRFSVDIRSSYADDIDNTYKSIKLACNNKIFPNHEYLIEPSTNIQPTPMCKSKMQELLGVCAELKIPYLQMASGAGHDAQIFAKHMNTNMIFVPSCNGISHTPEEFTKIEHILKSIDILVGWLKLSNIQIETGCK